MKILYWFLHHFFDELLQPKISRYHYFFFHFKSEVLIIFYMMDALVLEHCNSIRFETLLLQGFLKLCSYSHFSDRKIVKFRFIREAKLYNLLTSIKVLIFMCVFLNQNNFRWIIPNCQIPLKLLLLLLFMLQGQSTLRKSSFNQYEEKVFTFKRFKRFAY